MLAPNEETEVGVVRENFFYTQQQAQAMVDRTYALALNEASCAVTNGWPKPWQACIPKVLDLVIDLRRASTWPLTKVASGSMLIDTNLNGGKQ